MTAAPPPCGEGGVGGWLAGNSSRVHTVNSAYGVYGISSPPCDVGGLCSCGRVGLYSAYGVR